MKSKGCTEFLDHVNGLFERISRESVRQIEEAAVALVEAIKKDAIIHVAGCRGHSQIPAMEMFYRAGGLAGVSIVFGPGLGLFDGQPCLERVPGMGGATMATMMYGRMMSLSYATTTA